MVESMAHDRIKVMARISRKETYPGDWNRRDNTWYRTALTRCAYPKEPFVTSLFHGHGPTVDSLKSCHKCHLDIYVSICFGWELAYLADLIVDMLDLPSPLGQSCLFWDRSRWPGELAGMDSQYRDQYTAILNQLKSLERRARRSMSPRKSDRDACGSSRK
ncbi:hypothetical protein F4861DRAFT_525523 [Xylaria intraflava]|nr:hypothetical protein F4861DRAFT_525523 [Xylaria intraflava]